MGPGDCGIHGLPKSHIPYPISQVSTIYIIILIIEIEITGRQVTCDHPDKQPMVSIYFAAFVI